MLQYPLLTLNDNIITPLDLLQVLLIVVATLVLSRTLKRVIEHLGKQFAGFSEASLFTLSRVLHYLLLVVGAAFALASVGLDLSSIAIVAGALSVGIGFGLQSICNNFISGLILLAERPLKVGDIVELESGVRGRIKSINVRSTQICTRDNIDILVPNSEFISGRVINYTLDDTTRKLHIPFGVSYSSDKETVRKAALEATQSVPYTLQGENYEQDVRLVGFGASSLDFELVVWIDNNNLPRETSIVSLYLWQLHERLTAYDIEIPFPQQDLYIKSLPTSELSSS